VPGYEPFLLCDFHVHTSWSDGRLSVRDVVDLYGKTRRFDVIAITDHILMKRDLLARAGRLLSLGRREFSITESPYHQTGGDQHQLSLGSPEEAGRTGRCIGSGES
jgi:predicted metal-dependent phosphoesterase TrpH